MCTFFFRCLILTQKIAGFNSFARWLRKEQLTVSAKCLCQNPKQPIPINIKSRTELLKCKCKTMGWKKKIQKNPRWDDETSSWLRKENTQHPLSSQMLATLLGWEADVFTNERGLQISTPRTAPLVPFCLARWEWSSKSHVRNLYLFGWMEYNIVFNTTSCFLKWDLFHRSEWYWSFKWMI